MSESILEDNETTDTPRSELVDSGMSESLAETEAQETDGTTTEADNGDGATSTPMQIGVEPDGTPIYDEARPSTAVTFRTAGNDKKASGHFETGADGVPIWVSANAHQPPDTSELTDAAVAEALAEIDAQQVTPPTEDAGEDVAEHLQGEIEARSFKKPGQPLDSDSELVTTWRDSAGMSDGGDEGDEKSSWPPHHGDIAPDAMWSEMGEQVDDIPAKGYVKPGPSFAQKVEKAVNALELGKSTQDVWMDVIAEKVYAEREGTTSADHPDFTEPAQKFTLRGLF